MNLVETNTTHYQTPVRHKTEVTPQIRPQNVPSDTDKAKRTKWTREGVFRGTTNTTVKEQHHSKTEHGSQ